MGHQSSVQSCSTIHHEVSIVPHPHKTHIHNHPQLSGRRRKSIEMVSVAWWRSQWSKSMRNHCASSRRLHWKSRVLQTLTRRWRPNQAALSVRRRYCCRRRLPRRIQRSDPHDRPSSRSRRRHQCLLRAEPYLHATIWHGSHHGEANGIACSHWEGRAGIS